MPLKPIKINLSTFEYQDKFVAYPIMVFAALIVLALSAYHIQLALRYENEIFDYEQRLARLEERQAEKTKKFREQRQKFKEEDVQSIREGARFFNELIIQDAFPWSRVLSALERHLPPRVILLNFALSEGRKKIKIEGKTHAMTEITRFLSGLEASRVFENNALIDLTVTSGDLAKHRQSETMDITFQIECLLRGDELLKQQKTAS